jgi:hypothetical protein
LTVDVYKTQGELNSHFWTPLDVTRTSVLTCHASVRCLVLDSDRYCETAVSAARMTVTGS